MALALNLYSLEVQKYEIKPYHKALSLKCEHCHETSEPKAGERLGDKVCLDCHKSKEFLATRLEYLGKKNPHNSIHDGTNLSCYVCHSSHKPSQNMCKDCHNTKTWMKEIQ